MLQRISIQNFKSLKDVTLDLQQVNLLIGPNNSGKTNLLKVLEYFRRAKNIPPLGTTTTTAYEQETKYANQHTSQYEKIVYRNAIGEDVKIELLLDSTPYTCICTAYIQSITPANSDFSTSIFRPDPNTFIAPQTLSENKILKDNCSNIATFLLSLFSDEREIFESLEQDFHATISDFKRISVVPENGKLFLRFTDTKGNKFGADEVSEGVLYFLALLCIVHQPNPPKLLLLEEPERGIHPRRIREVMDFIFRLAEEKDIQVIMTSHNENVVNYFSSMPESVFVFDKDEEGATQVRNLLKDIIEPSHQNSERNGVEKIDFTDDLGKNWIYGLLGGVPE